VKYRLGHTDEALALYRSLSEHSTVWLPRVAEIELERGRRDEAERLCEEALARDAGKWQPIANAERLLVIAKVLERCGKLQRALELAERAVGEVEAVRAGKLPSASARSPAAVLEPMVAYLAQLRKLHLS
jgi:tetratricopeptide (TPR) repeat protein